MTKLDLILLAAAILLLFKLIKEMMYIRLYAFIIKLQGDGKLLEGADPKGLSKKAAEELHKNRSKYF
jgi:hypothetical protein